MSDELRALFRLHAAASLLLGLPLVLFPGPFLGAIGWTPIDPILSRIAGAGLLALGWSTFRALLVNSTRVALIVIETEAVFSIVGALGVLDHLLAASYPPAVLILFGYLALSAVVWITFRVIERPRVY